MQTARYEHLEECSCGDSPLNDVACARLFAAAFILKHNGPDYITRDELWRGMDAIAQECGAPEEAVCLLKERELAMSHLVRGMIVTVDMTDTRNVCLGIEKTLAKHLLLMCATRFFENRSEEWNQCIAKLTREV